MGTNVGDHRSPTFRREVADIVNQWAEKSHLSLSLSGLQKTREKLVLPLLGLYLIPDIRITIRSLGALSSCHHLP